MPDGRRHRHRARRLGDYELRNLFLANWVFGEPRLGPPWRFWFVEALVVALLVVAALVRAAPSSLGSTAATRSGCRSR